MMELYVGQYLTKINTLCRTLSTKINDGTLCRTLSHKNLTYITLQYSYYTTLEYSCSKYCDLIDHLETQGCNIPSKANQTSILPVTRAWQRIDLVSRFAWGSVAFWTCSRAHLLCPSGKDTDYIRKMIVWKILFVVWVWIWITQNLILLPTVLRYFSFGLDGDADGDQVGAGPGHAADLPARDNSPIQLLHLSAVCCCGYSI